MEEIKVGEYVRTDCGTIIKVKKIEKDEETKDIWYYEGFCLGAWKSRVVKHSPNIIDLIEVGDYVNGYKVRATYLEGERQYIKFEKLNDIRMYEKDIDSIVTHEQYNSIKYVIGE